MTVSRDEVNEMERLRRVMKGEKPIEKPIEIAQRETNGEIILSKGPTSQDVNAMAKIMENFSKITGVKSFRNVHDTGKKINEIVTNIADRAQDNYILREALNTEKTPEGIKIGAWEIKKIQIENHIGKPESQYKIYNINTKQSLKVPFSIFESAKTIIKLLNNGAPLNHPTIKEIANLEIEYRRQKQQALEEKYFYNKAKKSNDQFKQDLYEAKFDAARSRAFYTRERIKNIYYKVADRL